MPSNYVLMSPQPVVAAMLPQAMTFNDAIKAIDTCRVYHSGPEYFVEIDIVMDGEMPLWKAHDIAQVRGPLRRWSVTAAPAQSSVRPLDRTCKIK